VREVCVKIFSSEFVNNILECYTAGWFASKRGRFSGLEKYPLIWQSGVDFLLHLDFS